MSWIDFLLASICMGFGATLQGSVGFGMGLLGSPILMLIDPGFVPGPILLSTLVLTLGLTHREHQSIDLRGVAWALSGRIVGTIAGAAVLALLPADELALLFGTFVLLAVAMTVSGLRLEPTRPILVGAGTLSGVMGTVASIGGPPMALVYQHATGSRIRATMSGFFFAGTILSIAALAGVGRFGVREVLLTLVLLPGVFAGFLVSGRTARLLDRGYTRAAVLVTSGISGLVVILRQLL